MAQTQKLGDDIEFEDGGNSSGREYDTDFKSSISLAL